MDERGGCARANKDLCKDAILNHNMPIDSAPQDGYFLINTQEELSEAVNNLELRMRGYRKELTDYASPEEENSNHVQMVEIGNIEVSVQRLALIT